MVRAHSIGFPGTRKSVPISVHCDLHHINEGIVIPSLKSLMKKNLPICLKMHSVRTGTPFTPAYMETHFHIFYTRSVDRDGILRTEAILLRRVNKRYENIESILQTKQVARAVKW